MSFRITPVHGSWPVARTRSFAALITFVGLVVFASTPNAAQPVIAQRPAAPTLKVFIGGLLDDDWSTDINWFPLGEPGPDDAVIIPTGTVCHVRTSNASAKSFDVLIGGALLIHNQLTIHDDSSVVDPFGVELIRENPNDPAAPTLVIDGDVVLSGSGSIRGKEDDAQIKIRRYRSLTNKACIEGVLRILDPDQSTNMSDRGTLTNAGEIVANGDGDLVVTSSISITSHATIPGEWKIAHSSSRLWLRASASPLIDSFVIVDGELEVDSPIVTSGDLIQDGGVLNVEADLTLHHLDYPESKSRYTFNGGSGSVACDVTFSYDDFAGTQENPDNTKDEDPPYEVVGPPCGG